MIFFTFCSVIFYHSRYDRCESVNMLYLNVSSNRNGIQVNFCSISSFTAIETSQHIVCTLVSTI